MPNPDTKPPAPRDDETIARDVFNAVYGPMHTLEESTVAAVKGALQVLVREERNGTRDSSASEAAQKRLEELERDRGIWSNLQLTVMEKVSHEKAVAQGYFGERSHAAIAQRLLREALGAPEQEGTFAATLASRTSGLYKASGALQTSWDAMIATTAGRVGSTRRKTAEQLLTPPTEDEVTRFAQAMAMAAFPKEESRDFQRTMLSEPTNTMREEIPTIHPPGAEDYLELAQQVLNRIHETVRLEKIRGRGGENRERW